MMKLKGAPWFEKDETPITPMALNPHLIVAMAPIGKETFKGVGFRSIVTMLNGAEFIVEGNFDTLVPEWRSAMREANVAYRN